MLFKNRFFYKLMIFIGILSLLLPNVVLANNTIMTWTTPIESEKGATNSNNQTVTTNTKPTSELNLDCGSAILIEQHSGKILYEQNSHEKLRPASVTKVMTILLIMEAIDSGKLNLTDKIPCSEKASSMGGSQIWLDPREELTVDEMLKAICVVSANDCTTAMAEHLSRFRRSFCRKNE